VILISPVAQSLGCRVLEDGLRYVFFLLALGGLMTSCIFAVRWFLHCFRDGGSHSRKQTTFSKGAVDETTHSH
jgi:hypothetical protein